MTPITKQDSQRQLDVLKSQICAKVVTRQDVQTITDGARDRLAAYVHETMQINQQAILRQGANFYDQANRRLAAIEAKVLAQDQQLRAIYQALDRLAGYLGPQHLRMPNQAEAQQYQRQYLYRPA